MVKTTRQQLSKCDPWYELRRLTAARIALGRCGGSLPTREWLDFKFAHAGARDAVHCVFDTARMEATIKTFGLNTVIVDSAVSDRTIYLQRPDLGRLLDPRSNLDLQAVRGEFDLVIIVSDGLSARAVHTQVGPLLAQLLPMLKRDAWALGPIVVARYGRVALEDEIGKVIGAKIAVILIGERPGLGSPDSLGAYLVYNPGPGNTDANRNCISNIRPEGLDYEKAADTLYYLMNESKSRKLSGVLLKDERRMLDHGSTSEALQDPNWLKN